MRSAAFFRMAAVVGAVAGLAGCSSSPEMIVSDDAALCRYAAEAGGAEPAASCRSRLAGQHRTRLAANAIRIEGYALLNTPAPPTELADQCKQADAPKECGDVTGTIKRDPAK
jgi:hypothetical protein